jgi:hypothetical protein
LFDIVFSAVNLGIIVVVRSDASSSLFNRKELYSGLSGEIVKDYDIVQMAPCGRYRE